MASSEDTAGVVANVGRISYAPPELDGHSRSYPRLTPWALFWRPFAAELADKSRKKIPAPAKPAWTGQPREWKWKVLKLGGSGFLADKSVRPTQARHGILKEVAAFPPLRAIPRSFVGKS